jgi:hypothetical protein
MSEPIDPEVVPTRRHKSHLRDKFRKVFNDQERAILEAAGLPPLNDEVGEELWYRKVEQALKPLKLGWHGPAVKAWVDRKRANPEMEYAKCTLCCPGGNEETAPGFVHACLINDVKDYPNDSGWSCDGQCNLSRPKKPCISHQ